MKNDSFAILQNSKNNGYRFFSRLCAGTFCPHEKNSRAYSESSFTAKGGEMMKYSKKIQREQKITHYRQLAGEALILISIGLLWAGLFIWSFFEVIP